METSQAKMGDSFEQFIQSKKFDNKGRAIGYVVGLRDNGTDFYAWVQNARADVSGGWVEFGVRQRSRKFNSADKAKSWAYRTAKDRIAKLA